jgi:hypothetical protein
MPKKVKRKKGRVIWAVCCKFGGKPQDSDGLIWAYSTKEQCLNSCELSVDKPVKFVECLTEGRGNGLPINS